MNINVHLGNIRWVFPIALASLPPPMDAVVAAAGVDGAPCYMYVASPLLLYLDLMSFTL